MIQSLCTLSIVYSIDNVQTTAASDSASQRFLHRHAPPVQPRLTFSSLLSLGAVTWMLSRMHPKYGEWRKAVSCYPESQDQEQVIVPSAGGGMRMGRESLVKALRASLQRLGREQLDLYQVLCLKLLDPSLYCDVRVASVLSILSICTGCAC